MDISQDKQGLVYQIVIYVCGFLLFCEWLRPLEMISNTQNVKVFLIYAGFCFFISFLQITWMISVPLKLLGLLFIIDGLYVAERIFSGQWFSVVYDQVIYNIQVIQSQQWWEMTPLFRSLLFLILLWLMSYLLYYWFIISKRMLVFVLLTFVYVTVVDTFTMYDGQWAIIRTFILAMVSLGLAHFFKEMDKEEILLKGVKKAYLWALPLIGVIMFSTLVGYASPKLDPQWPDPVPYLTSSNSDAGAGPGGRVQKVGYGENDSRLGGSFIQDDTTVFQAVADNEQYWRIESKDTYTGKGWEDTLADPVTNISPDNIKFQTFTENVEVEEQTALLNFTDEADFRKLVYPYGVQELERFPERVDITLHENTGEMDTLIEGDPNQVQQYITHYNAPSFEYNQLRETNGEDPEEITENYLQLPDSLPDRVRELASDIVSEEDNRYDRAKAVESYFSQNGFKYSTTDVPVPSENQDYVDQFLFESQVGYCDNYSTSMVVLLRAEGIPARWVKGFTGGERQNETATVNNQTLNVYEVTSGNAHSWVEVYFPEIGWVPFEPTQGFTNNTDFHLEIDETEEEAESAAANAEEPEEGPTGRPEQTQEQQASASQSDTDSGQQTTLSLWISLLAALIIAAALYYTRFRWMTAILIRRFRKRDSEDTYERAYQYLLKVLEHRGLKRSPDQTLRDYARKVDTHFQSNDMRKLTNNYERVLYRNEGHKEQWREVTELWENLIKKALS
ncbi:transglutaminaseTgpA domain-containing protein [Halobacillus shinanisalinarum]|uniref:TransglutaminaseTgpA domain-containing protein n=1 Tax=Halobacillus shinanisalinarum TaxID=2932258 RepID=A0ABY4GVK9_9BACI|nr:transglutaminase domain-containing protein [Halobacillus shinanisalinarum]UOQ92001.1 transglutaminaseTgpA domain-containing protein [Halobacillus shinanisalinarum]